MHVLSPENTTATMTPLVWGLVAKWSIAGRILSMQHLTKGQLDELRAALDGEQVDLEEQLAEHGKKIGDDWTGTPVGFEKETDSDPEDAADAMEELATNVPLVEELESRLKDVKNAITKMDAGTYGICEESGKEIPFDRLEANPAARTAIASA